MDNTDLTERLCLHIIRNSNHMNEEVYERTLYGGSRQLIEKLNRSLVFIKEWNIADPFCWTSLKQIYFDEYDGDSATCEIHGTMRVSFLESLRQSVGGSNKERRDRTSIGGLGNYKTAESWAEFKNICMKELFPKGYGCTIQVKTPRDITIYEGNHRIRAAAEMGMRDMPVHIKFYHNSERFLKNIFIMDHIIENMKKLKLIIEKPSGYLETIPRIVEVSPSLSSKILR